MRGMSLAAVAVMAVCWPGCASSQEQQFAVEGAGRMECSAFMAAHSDKGSADYQRLMGFIEGYLSAANRYERDTFDLTPWHNAVAFDIIVGGYCKDHPKETLVSVVQRMVIAFRPIRVAKFSPLVEVGDMDHRAFVYEAILRRSQAALRRRGLYDGPEDGIYGPRLRDAFASFQRSRKLEPTGVPDPATLWMLLNP